MPTEKSPGEAKRKTLSLFSSIASLFILTQALGLYSGTFIIDDARGNEIVSSLGMVSAQPGSGLESAFYMLMYVLFGALAMFLVLKFYKGDFLLRLIEFAVISVSSSIVFYALLKPLLHITMLSAGLAIILALAFAAAKMIHPGLRNIAAVVATAGAGAVFGFSLGFFPALVFLVLLSIYDYIAVFKTKHMVEMADAVSKKQMAFVISSREKTEHGEIGFELGTGDMLMP
ncbi:MAG: presenilin family intramembrane aspartyl protease, partial [Candidatus Micrarchaeia archaeon]